MDEFKARRAKLAQQLAKNSLAILPGARIKYRNNDCEFKFRQNSDFYYLTEFCEPDAVMVLTRDSAGKTTYILFNRANNPALEVWTGKRAGQEGAKRDYHADEAFDINDLDKIMPKILADKQVVYYPFSGYKHFLQRIEKWIQNAVHSTIDLNPLIHEMRLFKSEQELNLMRKAAEISAQAHIKLMQACKPGMKEYQLQAIFDAHCLDNGCSAQAYNSIVASGDNSCTLHYTDNDQTIKNGDLVLVDAGGEYKYYAADITRTFPANGKFTVEQKQIYNLVLRAQFAGIAHIKPGNRYDTVQNAILEVLVTGLIDLGLLKGNLADLIRDKAYQKFYMHSSGHWLGLDVHDAGSYKQNEQFRKFEPGMVLTVEPGLYISASTGVDKKWLGIGVRIEDDVLVTDTGYEILSAKAPKQIEELESVIF